MSSCTNQIQKRSCAVVLQPVVTLWCIIDTFKIILSYRHIYIYIYIFCCLETSCCQSVISGLTNTGWSSVTNVTDIVVNSSRPDCFFLVSLRGYKRNRGICDAYICVTGEMKAVVHDTYMCHHAKMSYPSPTRNLGICAISCISMILLCWDIWLNFGADLSGQSLTQWQPFLALRWSAI